MKPCLQRHRQKNTSSDLPQTMKEALKWFYAKEWQIAINVELQSLDKNNIWKFIPIPSN